MQRQYDTLIDRVIRDGIKNYCYRRVECGANRDQRAREHRQEWGRMALPGLLAQAGVKHGRLLSAGAVEGWMTQATSSPNPRERQSVSIARPWRIGLSQR